MRIVHLPTVPILVAATRCPYHGGGGRYTYPWDTYPSLGYLRPLGYLPPWIPTPPYLPPGYLPPRIDMGPEIAIPQKGPGTRDTYVSPPPPWTDTRLLPSRNYCCGRLKINFQANNLKENLNVVIMPLTRRNGCRTISLDSYIYFQ